MHAGTEEFPFTAEQLLLRSVTDYAIYMLDAEGYIRSWNPGGERIKGYTDAEVLGQHFSRFYPPEDVARGEPEYALELARRHGRHETEAWRVRKDGSRFRAHIVIDPILHEGQLLGYAKVTRDITERFMARQDLKNAERALAQSQKIHAVGQLTLGIAHDFNNLLAVITASLDQLGQAVDAPRRQRLVDAAQLAAERGTRLTRQMLAFAKGQHLSPADHDINALIQASADVYRRAAGAITTCELELMDGPAWVHVDGDQFEAALMNLVANARDAMEAPGRIVISTRAGRADPRMFPSAQADFHYLYIAVADNGPGMSEDVRLRAMEPFFSTKDVGRGSGLGLSQVFGFASQSGGFAFIESEVGAGTTVTMALPLAAQAD
jgi:PAS domain S-box-containing protein